MRNLTDPTFGMYERFKCFNTYVFALFAAKQVVLFIEAASVSTPYGLPSLLATFNQMSRFGEVPHGSYVD